MSDENDNGNPRLELVPPTDAKVVTLVPKDDQAREQQQRVLIGILRELLGKAEQGEIDGLAAFAIVRSKRHEYRWQIQATDQMAAIGACAGLQAMILGQVKFVRGGE